MCVCVCFQIKTRQVFRQLLPRVTGKKAIFVPHLFRTLILQMKTPDMWSKLLLYNSIKQVLSQLAQRLQWGLYYHRTLPDSGWDTQSGSGGGQTCKQQHLSCGATACERPGLHAGARVLVLMQQRKEEEFVFMAIYRKEWCLWHSSCSPESSDTLTFSQLS